MNDGLSYPSASDYMQAVQHPAVVFSDEVLRKATFPLGPGQWVPTPAGSGTFAVVFRAEVDGEMRALRFFTQPSGDRERYVRLAGHLDASGLNGQVVRATWSDEAIRVRGERWPLVDMPWVQGGLLDSYVDALVRARDSAALLRLAVQWRQMIVTLQDNEFAHGDLQHGNVMVDQSGELRLVDLDGAWVPALAGLTPPDEDGHPNYQRRGRPWGPWMDTFPGLVVYTALVGLARSPAAWPEGSTRDRILFDSADLSEVATPTWQALERIDDPALRFALGRLSDCCRDTTLSQQPLTDLLPWWELPPLGDGVGHGGPVPLPHRPPSQGQATRVPPRGRQRPRTRPRPTADASRPLAGQQDRGNTARTAAFVLVVLVVTLIVVLAVLSTSV